MNKKTNNRTTEQLNKEQPNNTTKHTSSFKSPSFQSVSIWNPVAYAIGVINKSGFTATTLDSRQNHTGMTGKGRKANDDRRMTNRDRR